jgi:RND family efflux transporter MFP subunit
MIRINPVVLMTVLLLGACSEHETSQPEVTAVEVAAVREIASGGGLRYSATVEPDAQVAVAFRVSGYVENVAVEEGDRVSRGTVLARIRASDYAEKLGQASASQAEAQAALEQARGDLARARTLFSANALTKPELDAAVAGLEISQARVNRGRAAAGEANLALRDTALVAPIDGVILRRNVERGDLGTPGATAFVLADTRIVKVMFGAPDTMIRSLRPGQTIDVSTESMPERTFSGRIARIAPSADPKTRNFDVELHIENASNELKPGMVASLEIENGSAPLLAIPLDAVVRGGQAILPVQGEKGQAGLPVLHSQYAVYVVENGKARARGVELGDPMGNLVALRAGLQNGDRVVVSGPALLVDGQAVRVVSGGSYAQQ